MSSGKTVLLVTDAYSPQVNGVVTTLKNIVSHLSEQYTVDVISPNDAKFSISTPYPDVKLCWHDSDDLANRIDRADAIHIATPEGSLGIQASRVCCRLKRKFTTGYHTNWGDFLKAMWGIPANITDWFVKRAHKHSQAILVPTLSVKHQLENQGYSKVVVWSRGVHPHHFDFEASPKDYLLCVSRISQEKNLEAFFALPGKKVMVGDGPLLGRYRKQYPDVNFVGHQQGRDLVEWYRGACCFVFPSRSDTFGLVMIEAMAAGTPVAAYPVTGPIDVVANGVTGCLHQDLRQAVREATKLDRRTVHDQARTQWSWDSATKVFIDNLCFRT